PAVVGANFTRTVWSCPFLTRTGFVGETIWNWLQSAPPCSTTVTTTSVPLVELSVSSSVADWLTVMSAKSSGSGVRVTSACAVPLPPNQTPSSNSPSQYFEIAMPPSRVEELAHRDCRRDYNAIAEGGKLP